jgi:hypothetical protein
LDLLGNAVLAKGKDWVEKKTGVSLDSMDLSSEQLLTLRQYQLDHEEELLKIAQESRRMEIDLEKAYLADSDSARKMQIAALEQDDKFAKRFVYYFALAWTIGAMTYIGFLTFGNIPPDNIRFADTILGFMLGTIISQMISFFYGSSKSSQRKDEVIGEVVTKSVGRR